MKKLSKEVKAFLGWAFTKHYYVSLFASSFLYSWTMSKLLMLTGVEEKAADSIPFLLVIMVAIIHGVALTIALKTNWRIAPACRRMVWWHVKYMLIKNAEKHLGFMAYMMIMKIELGLTKSIFIRKGHKEMVKYLCNPGGDDDDNDDADDGVNPDDPELKQLKKESKKIAYEMNLYVN